MQIVKVVNETKSHDMLPVPVSGESMAPEYPNGSRVLVKPVNVTTFFEWGRDYVIDTCNGIVFRRVVPSEKANCIKCVALNPDPIYAPFEIDVLDIKGFYRVHASMTLK